MTSYMEKQHYFDRIDVRPNHWESHDLPSDPDQENETFSMLANEAISFFQVLTGTDRADAWGDLLSFIMNLCDRDPELGSFEDGLATAYFYYEDQVRPRENIKAKANAVKSAIRPKSRKK